jgi:succinate dehydrogenase / fumarate reductase cytochrome b subunit
MVRRLALLDTDIGQKAVVAISGVVLFGFVVVHMLGNLQVFLGPDALNHYAETLRRLPALVWGTRVALVVAVCVHVWASIALVLRAAAARPTPYGRKQSLATSYAARTMKWSGPILAAFIVYHLAHFTWPGVAMGAYAHDPHDVYANVVNGFRVPWVSAIYVVAQVLLGLHLYHGGWSLFQTLGINHPRYDTVRTWVPRTIAMVVMTGNIAIPLAVLLGIVR